MFELSSLSGDDEIWLGQIDKSFAEAVKVGNEIIAITAQPDELLERLEMDLEKVEWKYCC